MQILTNSFPIAEHLLRHSRNSITVPGGAIYREQNIILSPFENDVARNFYARRMFMSAQGLSPMGVMEGDPLLIQAEQKLINQAEELVVLIDSSKFAARSSLILCPLDRVHTIVTDDSVSTRDARFVEQSGIRLVVAAREAGDDEASSSAA
jgi:DeoR family ulaG and ulaABCDEF operon transcriptional repressor